MQSGTSTARKMVHVERIAIRWGDMDAMGHVSVDGELYADGAATVVFIDMQKQKPIRIPQVIREVMQ